MNINITNDINNVPTNVYTIQLKKSFEWFGRMYMKKPSEKDWIDLFGEKRAQIVTDIEALNLTEARKTAIILLGISSCGKTTFALNFVNSYPNFCYCSYDSAGVDVLSEFVKRGLIPQEDILDAYMAYEFGELLKSHKKNQENIIIDGSWVSPNSRGALINTLRRLDYQNIIIFSFLKMSQEEANKRLVSRAVRQAIQSKRIKSIKNNHVLADDLSWFVTADFEEVLQVSEKSLEEIIRTPEFVSEYTQLANNYFKIEPFNSTLHLQMAENIFTYGADYFVDLF